MWFKNLRIYRFTKPLDISPEKLEEELANQSFSPCGNHDFFSYGWVPPLGQHGELYTHSCNGYTMICARKQEKLLPAAAINELVEEKVVALEANQERSVYRKERRNIKEEVVHTLLPRALTRSQKTFAYIAPKQNLLVIDTASANKAEAFLDHLRHTLGSLPVVPLSCHGDAANIMTQWLKQGHTPKGFELDRECELRNPQESANTVRCKHQILESEEILSHIKAGKRVIQLGISWRDAISCILTDDFSIKRLRFEELILEEAYSEEDDYAVHFDQDFSVMTLQLSQFIDELLAEFGGIEKERS